MVSVHAGTLGDLGAHVISMAEYLVGDIVEVCGQVQTVVSERPVAADGGGYRDRAADLKDQLGGAT